MQVVQQLTNLYLNLQCKAITQASAGDELSIGANAISLNGGTIVDTAGGGNATITNSGAIGTAAGTITVALIRERL